LANVNPFSLEDDSLRRRGKEAQRSGYPRMQVAPFSTKGFYVKATRAGGGRRYLRDYYSATAESAKPVIKSKFIYRGPDSTRHLIHHVDYMMKSKIDREREPETRKLFNRDGVEISRDAGIRMALENQTRNLAGHKLILSPGDNNIDLVEYTREQMRVLEERFNADIDYSFSYQRNTDHHHIHVTLPASAKRRLDMGDGGREKVEIKLSSEDFKAMREAGARYLRNYNFVDHLTDKRVEADLLHDWYGDDARKRESLYSKQARKDLGLELTQADKDALRELGIELPYSGYVEPPVLNKPRERQPHVDRPGALKDELTSYLLTREAGFENDWSDRDIARVLQTSERDPEWVFPSAYSKSRQERRDTADVLLELRGHSRFDEFADRLQLHLDLRDIERKADALKSGSVKQEYIPESKKLEELFAGEAGAKVYDKLIELKSDYQSPDGKGQERLHELNELSDRHLQLEAERLIEKFNLSKKIDAEGRVSDAAGLTLQELKENVRETEKMMRVLKYKSSGNFVDSFERLVELKEGRDSIPKYKTVDERNYHLVEKLKQPEYSDERQQLGVLQERSFQLYSRFSSRDASDTSKESLRDLQVSLDSKILELEKNRFEFDENRNLSIHERSADAYVICYRQALLDGNEAEANLQAQKFHAAVMRLDDDRRRDENSLSANYDPGYRQEDSMLSGDPRHAGEHTKQDELDEPELERGESFKMPGYGLERLERDSEELIPDPSDIRVELTAEEFRRRHDDEEERGREGHSH